MKRALVLLALFLGASGCSSAPLTQLIVAVDTDRGLLVPVIHDVDKKNILDLARELGELSEKSLGWYASVKTPRLDNSGKPFPPRAQDVALEQAARTLWHQQHGSLTVGQVPVAAPASVDLDGTDGIPY